jgi:hypothetical protein
MLLIVKVFSMTKSKRILHIFIAAILVFALAGSFLPLGIKTAAASVEMPYYYFKLTDDERLAYDTVRAAALSFKKYADTSPALPDKSMARIASLLIYHDADTFNVGRVDYDSNSSISRFTFGYNCTKEKFAGMEKEIKARVDEILKSVAAETSGYKKLAVIHDAIVSKCVYTTNTKYENISNKYGALISGRANSFGYAESFTYIAGKAGILSLIDVSTKDGKSYAANKVYHGGRWYNIDCAANDTPGRFRETPIYGAFMVPDIYLTDYTPYTVHFTAPEAVTGGMYYYRALKLEATDNNTARKIIANGIVANNKTKKSTVSFSFADDAALDSFINTVSTTYYIVDTLDYVKKYVKNPIITDAADFTVNRKTRVVTIAIFYPDTKLSDYYTDISGFTKEQLEYYKELGINTE